jgi:hypothetical protein
VAVDGFHLHLGILECHFFVPLFFKIHLLFALPLAGRHAFLMRLLLSFMKLFRELLDFLALTHAVACRVMHRASDATVVPAGRLIGAFVASWASAPTCRRRCRYGDSSQRLVVAADLLLLLLVIVVVVAATLSSGARIGLAILACL